MQCHRPGKSRHLSREELWIGTNILSFWYNIKEIAFIEIQTESWLDERTRCELQDRLPISVALGARTRLALLCNSTQCLIDLKRWPPPSGRLAAEHTRTEKHRRGCLCWLPTILTSSRVSKRCSSSWTASKWSFPAAKCRGVSPLWQKGGCGRGRRTGAIKDGVTLNATYRWNSDTFGRQVARLNTHLVGLHGGHVVFVHQQFHHVNTAVLCGEWKGLVSYLEWI